MLYSRQEARRLKVSDGFVRELRRVVERNVRKVFVAGRECVSEFKHGVRENNEWHEVFLTGEGFGVCGVGL